MLAHVLWTLGINGPICLALGWWIGKKGAKNVAGDVQIAVQDAAKKVS